MLVLVLPRFLLLLFLINFVSCEDDQTMALKFLGYYGYISSARSGNHDVATAIQGFQKFYGLPASGKLDEATISLMKKPRCGMADPVEDGKRVRRYAIIGEWKKKHLTYFVQHGYDLPNDQQTVIFGRAFQFWADVSGLSFSEVNDARSADIKISFGRYTHGGTGVERTCPYPFDGSGGTLAHAYYPTDGRAHFDEDETFTHDTSSGTNLLWVATHEFGHSLGLAHSNVRGAIMYPYYTGYAPNMQLHSDDIAGIQYLYGPNTGGGGGTQTPAPTPTPTDSGNCNDRMGCKPYVEADYCRIYPDNMKYWCPKSCFNCNV